MASAIENWRKQVEDHNSQSSRVRGALLWASSDYWRPLLSNFRLDPRRTDDTCLNYLLAELKSDSTVIDVGGGAGRFALPLALRCKHVTVVEPADSMIEALNEGAREAGISNLTALKQLWEDAEVEPADIVLSAHSFYGVVEVVPFIRKLEANAKQQVIVVVNVEQAQSQLSPLWSALYGEERVDLPALRELMNVLWELDIYPSLKMFPPTSAMVFESREAAFEQIKHRLHVDDGSQEAERLRSVIADELVETPDGHAIKGSKPRRLAALSWTS